MNHTKLEHFTFFDSGGHWSESAARVLYSVSQSNHDSDECATGICRRFSYFNVIEYHYSLRTKLHAQLNRPDDSAYNDIEQHHYSISCTLN